MSFFSRLPKPATPATASTPAVERRRFPRFAVGADFPVKASLSYIGRDDTGAPMSSSRAGWNWKGRLVEFSEEGARLNMGKAMKAAVGEPCDLTLSCHDFEIKVPCQIANIRDEGGDMVFGLQHQFKEDGIRPAYLQLLEIVALASALAPEPGADQADASGYLLEQYASGAAARLTLWRNPKSRSVDAFQFQLNENLVRAYEGQNMEYIAYDSTADWVPAPGDRCVEIHRQFQWAAHCLPAAVPEDARTFLKRFAS